MAIYKTSQLRLFKNGYVQLLICCLFTLIAMYSHRYFPVKTLIFTPTTETAAYIYMDEYPDSSSRIEWVDQESWQWRCMVEADGKNYSCGFHFVIPDRENSKGMDFSDFDAVYIDMDYEGTDRRLRFYMRNYEPGLSDTLDIQNAKFNFLSVPVQFVDDNLVLYIKEFSVADWWIHLLQVPRELSQPCFENTVAFGIDLTYPSPPGQHDFKLNQVKFVGLWISAEQWYSSILFFWIVIIVAAGTINLMRLRRSYYREKAQHEALAKHNALLKAQTDKYKHLSLRDHLTGLLNRQGLFELIEEKFSNDLLQGLSLIVLDLDHFKQINDTLGHDGGDIVLREIATIFHTNIRQTDYVGRWGGEEFVIISPGTNVEDAHQLAEKLRSLVATHRFSEFAEMRVTVSIGIGERSLDETFDALFRRVDVALYQAKAQGRNRTVVARDE